MEAEEEVKPIRVYLKCPDCDVQMSQRNFPLSCKEQFVYKCTNCENIEKTYIRYPYIKYI